MLKKLILISFVIAGFFQSVYAYESTGYVKDLFINKDGLVLFRLNNPVNQRPKCATNADWDYLLDLQLANSEHQFKILQLALPIGKPLTVGYGPEAKCGKKIAAIKVEYLLFKNLYQKKHKQKGNYSQQK